ncbi:uncharacterized protein LOC100897460 [Galendromus occidentalis]|uniref:Uncharacterized protein LOC100897460 n=1 Tax=Galendromus occidentalis TaxID=34638 RepID=A0AAJ6W0B2_9ACAR|nr:uncharacterized protein LOC100897460 [Galendromus occidentalis]
MRVFHIIIVVSLAICLGTVNAQRKSSKKTTVAPAYDDYDDYDAATEEDPSTKNASVEGPSTTPGPVGEEAPAKGLFSKNHFKVRSRPSPHPAVKTKPTLPSFIKHPANIADLGHEHPPEIKATEPPLPRPKATSPKPHRFSATLHRKKAPPKEQPKEDYEYEDANEDVSKPKPTPSTISRPVRPRTRQ